jgi:signal peptidase I
MEPTIYQDQHLLIDKFRYQTIGSDVVDRVVPWTEDDSDDRALYLFHGPQRGDVIVFDAPTGDDTEFVKRVIGVPGDDIDIHDGEVWVNGKRLDDGRETALRGSTRFPLQVPEGHYFVLGDNRNASNDSRAFGFVPAEDIIGRVLARYWPLSDFKIF